MLKVNAVQITDLMDQYGANPKYKGYFYLAHTISLAKDYFDKNNLVPNVTELYAATARKYDTTNSAIERSMRTLVQTMWKNRNERMEHIYQECPDLSEFICDRALEATLLQHTNTPLGYEVEKDSDLPLDHVVYRRLFKLGIRTNLGGFVVLKDAILAVSKEFSENRPYVKFTALYVDLSNRYHIGKSAAERNMRHAIEKAEENRNDAYIKTFGNKKNVTVSEFICTVANNIIKV